MRIPGSASLDVQQAFRDIHEQLRPLAVDPIVTFTGRRIRGALPAQQNNDYVTLGDVKQLLHPNQLFGVTDDPDADPLDRATTPYDVAGFYPGVFPASERVMRVAFTRSVRFDGVQPLSSGASLNVATTNELFFTVQRNHTDVGLVVFQPGQFGGTVTLTSKFIAGDVLTVLAPASPDPTAADLSVTFAGFRL